MRRLFAEVWPILEVICRGLANFALRQNILTKDRILSCGEIKIFLFLSLALHLLKRGIFGHTTANLVNLCKIGQNSANLDKPLHFSPICHGPKRAHSKRTKFYN